MILAELEKKVLDIVQDTAFTGGVMPFINRGINYLAGSNNLAALDASDTVECTAAASSVDLPTNFMHGLYLVDDGFRRIGDPNYYNEYARFRRYNQILGTPGVIFDVAVQGNTRLHYVNSEDKTLNIRFFEKPTLLAHPGDAPTCLPEHLHEPLLVNFAAREIFNLIEDGVEDPKTNTKIYASLFSSYLQDLGMYTVDTDSPAYVQDEVTRIWR